jgi:hypothetical protein
MAQDLARRERNYVLWTDVRPVFPSSTAIHNLTVVDTTLAAALREQLIEAMLWFSVARKYKL